MRKRFNDLALGAAVGSAMGYFLDPDRGRGRRKLTLDRIGGLVRRGGRHAERAGRAVGAQVYGMSQQVQHLQEEAKDFDDVTLTRKVETELFRPAEVPNGQIVVNVQGGLVQLRGEVPRPEMIQELAEKARRIQGVREVENLLHLPRTDAPMHQ